jgi:hypothetical protein
MALQASLVPSDVHRAEARRMKAFAGQRQFQAPVADDFRGHARRRVFAGGGGSSLKPSGLIDGLTAWWHRKGWVDLRLTAFLHAVMGIRRASGTGGFIQPHRRCLSEVDSTSSAIVPAMTHWVCT